MRPDREPVAAILLGGIRGGGSLRGATIGSDQIVPAALALFDAIGISVDDDESGR